MKPMSMIVNGTANPHVKICYYREFANFDFVKLEAIADHDETRLKEAEAFFKDKKPGVKFYRDWREMYEKHSDVEAILVGSDNVNHCEHTVAAAEMGKNIFSMKVMSMNETECREMTKAVRKNKVKMQVELELHFHPQILNIRRQIQSGQLGAIKSIYISNISQSPINYFPDWGKPELIYGKRMPIHPRSEICRGGAITDHPHPFDIARWFTGAEFKKVFAVSAKNMRDHLKVEDHAAINGEMTDGTRILINPSYSHLEEKVPVRRLYWPKSLECLIKVTGEKGVAMADFWNYPVYSLGSNAPSPNRMLFDNGIGMTEFGETRLSSFFMSCRGKRKIESTAEDGLAAVQVMNAAYDSIYQNTGINLD